MSVKVFLGLLVCFTFVTPLHCAFSRCSVIARPACICQALPVPSGWRKGHIFNGICFLITVGLKQSGISDWHLGEPSPPALYHPSVLHLPSVLNTAWSSAAALKRNCQRWDTLTIICICSTLAAVAQYWCPVCFRSTATAGTAVSCSS